MCRPVSPCKSRVSKDYARVGFAKLLRISMYSLPVKTRVRSGGWGPYFNVLPSFQRHRLWIRYNSVLSCPAMTGYVASSVSAPSGAWGCENQSAEASRGTQVRYRNGQGPNSLQDRRLGRSTPSRHRSGRNCRSGVVASRCAAWSGKHRKHSSRSDGVPERQPGGSADARDRAVGQRDRHERHWRCRARVTPGHAVTAASMFGKALRRSSPTATALTRELHRGLAVRLAEVNFSTAPAVARAGAPSPSAPQR